jgi:hypothetical protein
MSSKKFLFRTILTFRAPPPNELRYLTSLLVRAKTIENQQLYIAEPDTNLLFASSCSYENMEAIQLLIKKPWSEETVNEINNISSRERSLR